MTAIDLHALMGIALDEALAATDHDDVPVGAVVVRLDTGEVVARRHNERELLADPTAHAEILAMRDAAISKGSWRLDGHLLVVTLEPCPMCAGAAVVGRISEVAFGASDPKAGALGTLYNLAADRAPQPPIRRAGRRAGRRVGGAPAVVLRRTAHMSEGRRVVAGAEALDPLPGLLGSRGG